VHEDIKEATMTSKNAPASDSIKISRRAQAVPWSGIRHMFELAAKVPGAISLSVGQPDFDTPEHIVMACQKALAEGHTRYAPALGLASLREAIAHKVWRNNGIDINPQEETIVTSGAVEGLLLILMAVLDPGDEVLLPDPGYTNFEGIIRIINGVPVRVPVREENGFRLAAEQVEQAIGERTRVMIVNSPANPTGALLHHQDLVALAEVALRHNLLLISDEAYEVFVYDGLEHNSIASLPGMKEHVASVYTLSKTYAMTGWRIGYVVGPQWLINQMHKMQEDVVSCVATFVQRAAIAALEGSQDCVVEMVAEFDGRRQFLVKALNEIDGLQCLEPRGAFYLFPNISELGRSSSEVAISLLETSKVVCVPGTAFGPRGEGYLRISYGASMKDLEEGVQRIQHGVNLIRS
jgi:aspartate/methionine/tyrosine aminotransferase